jgi:hypothetical protein
MKKKMNSFIRWKISNLLINESEFYFPESFIGIKSENENSIFAEIPGRKIYKVIDNNEESGIITIEDNDGAKFKLNQEDLTRALEESARANGWQTIQYPVGYLFTTSGTDLAKLSIYDGRLKSFLKDNKDNKKDKKEKNNKKKQ